MHLRANPNIQEKKPYIKVIKKRKKSEKINHPKVMVIQSCESDQYIYFKH